jgi:hypothetical protein
VRTAEVGSRSGGYAWHARCCARSIACISCVCGAIDVFSYPPRNLIPWGLGLGTAARACVRARRMDLWLAHAGASRAGKGQCGADTSSPARPYCCSPALYVRHVAACMHTRAPSLARLPLRSTTLSISSTYCASIGWYTIHACTGRPAPSIPCTTYATS